jgi:hypothetical protein
MGPFTKTLVFSRNNTDQTRANYKSLRAKSTPRTPHKTGTGSEPAKKIRCLVKDCEVPVPVLLGIVGLRRRTPNAPQRMHATHVRPRRSQPLSDDISQFHFGRNQQHLCRLPSRFRLGIPLILSAPRPKRRFRHRRRRIRQRANHPPPRKLLLTQFLLPSPPFARKASGPLVLTSQTRLFLNYDK